MANIEVDLLTDQGNNAVVQLPGRKYPGVLVQGDTLSTLITTTNEAIEALRQGDTGEAETLIRELLARLQDSQSCYEAALQARGIPLPY